MRKEVNVLFATLLLIGCGQPAANSQANANGEFQTVRLRIDGFMKSKSGAIWMAWPNAVKQALYGLDAVRDVQMQLDRDEFVVTYDAATASSDDLMGTIEKAGYVSYVVSGEGPLRNLDSDDALITDSVFMEALARAKREGKYLVVDFHANWCVPCKRMETETFADSQVAALLKQVVFLKIDTDKYPGLAKQLNVVGLPDVRFFNSHGEEIRRMTDFQDPEVFAETLTDLISQRLGVL